MPSFLVSSSRVSRDGPVLSCALMLALLTVSRFAYVPGGEAMVDFDATVTTSDGDVLLARSYWGRAPLAGDRPADGVNGLGVALGEAMAVFAGELAAALPAGQG